MGEGPVAAFVEEVEANAPKARFEVGPRRLKAVLIAGVILAIWAVLPSLMLPRSTEQLHAVIAAQLGESAFAYLRYAPPRLCRYVLLAPTVAPFAMLVLAWGTLHRGGLAVRAERGLGGTLKSLLATLLVWSSLYLCGELVVALGDARESTGQVIRSFAVWLGVYGLASTFPLWGWAALCALTVRRFWVVGVLFVGGWLVVAMGGAAGQSLRSEWPWPAQLKLQLLSGRAEIQPAAFAWLFVWGAAPVALSLLVLGRRSRRAPGSRPRV